MLSERDNNIIDFIDEFKMATSEQIKDLFFNDVSDSMCRRVLARMVDYGCLKRERDHVNEPYRYYIDRKPKQIRHTLMTTELYVEMKKLGWNVLKFMTTVQIGNVRPDAIVVIEYRESIYAFFVEIQLHGSMEQCTDKYKELFYDFDIWKEYFVSFPNVLVVTSRKEHMLYGEFKTLKVKTDFSDLKYIFKNLYNDAPKIDHHYKYKNKK